MRHNYEWRESFEKYQIAKLQLLNPLRRSLDPSNVNHLGAIEALDAIDKHDLEWKLKWERKREYYHNNVGIGPQYIGFWEGFIVGFGFILIGFSIFLLIEFGMDFSIGFFMLFAVSLTLFGGGRLVRVIVRQRKYSMMEDYYVNRQEELIKKALVEFDKLNLNE